jgi:hypothetical protein
MKKLTKTGKIINRIGRQLIHCRNECSGIICNPEKGIIPRCLYFECDNRKQNNGVVIIGINPGNSGTKTQRYWRNHKIGYNALVKWWEQKSSKTYYVHLRDFADNAGFKGPILWTELAKCEGKSPHIQTLRTCVNKYLVKEISVIPKEWAIIAVGREAFQAIAYLFSKRTVIGIPHPTGSYGHFSKLFKSNNKLKQRYKKALKSNNLYNKKEPKAIWLYSI